MFNVPVLLIAFNRPDTTQEVLLHIEAVKPQKLYVALDGPRVEREFEVDRCKQVRDLVTNLKWPCQMYFKFNEQNRGAEITVSEAITWVLSIEDCVIVLEDDIIAPPSFFYFMEEMLVRYKDEPRIAVVSGCNPTPIVSNEGSDYIFSNYGHIWGWATWKRAWDYFDLNISDFEQALSEDFLNSISISAAEKKYFKALFNNLLAKGKGNLTWDYCWYYIRLRNGFLSIVPRVNLTSNIGIYGLHANGLTESHFMQFDDEFKAIKHPRTLIRDLVYDKYHFEKFLNRRSPYFIRIVRRIRRMLRELHNE